MIVQQGALIRSFQEQVTELQSQLGEQPAVVPTPPITPPTARPLLTVSHLEWHFLRNLMAQRTAVVASSNSVSTGHSCGYATIAGNLAIRYTGAPNDHPHLRWEGARSYLVLCCR